MNTSNVSFGLGQVLFSALINHAISTESSLKLFVANSLTRHKSGDWGDLDNDDKLLNDLAITTGGRLFSSFIINDSILHDKIWIITEAKDHEGIRRCTTILFPSEY